MTALRAKLVRGLTTAVRAYASPYRRLFAARLADPARTDARLARELTRRMAATAYGQHLGVRGGDDLANYRRKVPIVGYGDLRPWIDRQMRDEGSVLTPDRVLFYEKTSGSSGPAKYIPYTARLRRSFSRMFVLWVDDLVTHGPKLETGVVYFSVSPSFADEHRTARGTPIGLDDDAEYVEGWMRPLLRRLTPVPPAVRQLSSASFRRALTLHLLASESLEVVSVWSPSFLSVVLEHLEETRHELLAILRSGGVTLEGRRFEWRTITHTRLRALERGDFPWPALRIVSSWANGWAHGQAELLAARLPATTLLQGKGLLATEAPVTFPLLGACGGVPLLGEVLVELEDDAGGIGNLADAVVGAEYAVVVSQLGGLHRYRLGDRVRVTGRLARTPLLDFVGRADVSDLAGEKLSSALVEEVLTRLVPAGVFRMLLPVEGSPPHYLLLLEGDDRDLGGASLLARLEASLTEVHHYRIARLLGQIGPARIVVRATMGREVHDALMARGTKLGDIKGTALVTARDLATGLVASLSERDRGASLG